MYVNICIAFVISIQFSLICQKKCNRAQIKLISIQISFLNWINRLQHPSTLIPDNRLHFHLRKMNVYGQKCLTSNYRCHCVIMLLCTVAWTSLQGQGRYLSIVIFVNTKTIAKMRGGVTVL